MTHTSSGIFIFVLTINYLADPTYGQFAETSPWVGGEPIGSDFGGTSPYSVIAGMHGGDSINSDFGSDGYVPEYPNPGIEFGVAPTLHGGDSINSDFGSDGYVPEYSDPGIEDDTPPFDEGLVPITIPPYDYSEDECIQDSSVVQDPTLKAPYTVSFQVQNEHDPNYRTHLCGGVLIADRFVLTAAHCFWNEQIDNHDFRESGDNEGVPSRALYGAIAPLCRHQQGMGVFKVERYFLHPEYRGRTMYGKDIAVVLLNSSSSTYQGPFVDYSSLDTFSNEEETLIGLGWGYVNGYEADTENHPNLFAKTVRALRKVPLKYLECDSIQDLAVPDDQFCATWFIRNRLGEMGDACKGDSGGPILKGYEGSGESPIGVGIVSWGPDECSGQGLPGVYTKVWMYKDWISETMEKYNQQQLQQQQQSPPPSEDTSVSPPPSEDTSVSPPPSEDTSVSPPPSEDSSVSPPPTEDSSVSPPPTEDTSVSLPPTEDTAVSPPTQSTKDDESPQTDQQQFDTSCPFLQCRGSSQTCCSLDPSVNSQCSVYRGMRIYNYEGTCEGGRQVWRPSFGSACYC